MSNALYFLHLLPTKMQCKVCGQVDKLEADTLILTGYRFYRFPVSILEISMQIWYIFLYQETIIDRIVHI